MAAAARKKTNKVPKSAEQKGAEAALQASQRLALEGQRARTAQSSRGAFKARQLRSSGTSLQQYDLAKFKADPFPALGGLGGGSNLSAGGGRSRGPRGATSGATSADGRARIKQQQDAKDKNRRRDNMNGPNNEEKMAAEAAARAKAKAAAAAAAAKAKKKKQQKLTDSKGGSVKAVTGKITQS